MLDKLSHNDLQVVIRCISFILSSGHYYAEEIGTRIGVDQQKLQVVHHLLQLIAAGNIDERGLQSRSDVSKDDVCLAIHNSLGDVGYAEEYDDDEMKQRYGITRLDVQAVLERWEEL